jgi:hypothetical protein
MINFGVMVHHLSDKPVHHPGTASRVFGDEAVIISPNENMVRMLNPSASRIWELADGSRTLEQIAQELVVEFDIDPAQARQSVDQFVDELMSKGLLVWSTE